MSTATIPGYAAGTWNVDTTHSEVGFSHGICPDCAETLFPDYAGRKGNLKV